MESVGDFVASCPADCCPTLLSIVIELLNINLARKCKLPNVVAKLAKAITFKFGSCEAVI